MTKLNDKVLFNNGCLRCLILDMSSSEFQMSKKEINCNQDTEDKGRFEFERLEMQKNESEDSRIF